MKITLPLPPSANKYWKPNGYGGMRSTDEAKDYKQSVKKRAFTLGFRKPAEGDVVVSLVVYRKWRRGDLDNFQKVLLDALSGVAYLDDAQIVEIHSRREEDPANPRVEVRIEEATA